MEAATRENRSGVQKAERHKRGKAMKTKFWNVVIQIIDDGTVKAAVLRKRFFERQPKDTYIQQPNCEVYNLWFASAEEADNAVLEALGWNEKKETVAA